MALVEQIQINGVVNRGAFVPCAGVCVVDFPDGAVGGAGNIRACNYTAHLGRWSVPITPEDMEAVCGIDGCF
jgi:hypothetical protein